MRRIGQLKQGERIIGNRTRAKIVKNKVSAPFKSTEFYIIYNEGISKSGDLLDTGVLFGVVEKNGNTHAFGEVKLGVGREVAKQFLKDNPKVMAEIREKVLVAAREKAVADDAPAVKK